MQVVLLAGGHGGAKMSRAVARQLQPIPSTSAGESPPPVTVIGNTADDIRLHRLHISPDLDTVMYTIGGGLDSERGWGRADEAFRANEELAAYGAPTWFGLGDRDFATHLLRTQMREAGYRLTEVTAALSQRWRLAEQGVTLLPMTDDRVETHVVCDPGDGQQALHFQQWWIEHRADIPTSGFLQVGMDEASITPEALSALNTADVVVVAPSNPIVSIDPILGVPGIRQAIVDSPATVVGVSPIIGDTPLRGMADVCLRVKGIDSRSASVAEHYGSRREGGLLDGWVFQDSDSEQLDELRSLGIQGLPTETIMSDDATSQALAATSLEFALNLKEGPHEPS